MVAPANLKTDPNVKLPSAVKKAADAIDAAYAASAAPTPPVTPEVIPPVTPEVIPPTPDAPAAPINWEHRFNSMKGHFNAAQNNVRAMSEQITLLQSQLAAAPVTATTPAELRPESLLTPEETNEYGADFLNVVGKKALEQVSPEMAQIKKDLAALNARIAAGAQTSAANARDTMNTWLDDNIPTWRAVNVTQEFHSWLALPEPFSGVIRHQLLSAAYEQNNTPRVAAFFTGFLANEAASAPQPGAEPDLQVQPTEKIPLESLAAPGRAKTAAPSGPVEKPTFTAAQVSKFYADSAAGRYRGREEEKNRIDAQIIEAGREGRIR